MDNLIPEIQRIAERISEIEGKRKRLAEFLKSVNPRGGIKERSGEDPLDDIRILGVDGGIAKKPVHGFDLVLARAVGVLFHYREGKVHSVRHFPSRFPTPKPFALEALSDLDYAYSTSIIRQGLEVDCARQCLKEMKPDMILMDGSIVPHYADRPSKNSQPYQDYKNLLGEWQGLYRDCLDNKIMLAGVIEDSRDVRFCDFVREEILSCIKHEFVPELGKILERTRDTNLLFWVLDRGERTKVSRYSSSPGEHPVLRDFPRDLVEKIYSFYLKTARWDRPVRVDFLGKENTEKISSVLLSISGQHSGYGIPVPIIEADNSAKMSEEEMENFYSRILSRTGNLPSMVQLRREMRPF